MLVMISKFQKIFEMATSDNLSALQIKLDLKREYQRRYREKQKNHPCPIKRQEFKDRIKLSTKKYREKNPELCRAQGRQYQKNYRKKITPEQKQKKKEADKRYRLKHAERIRTKRENRRRALRQEVHEEQRQALVLQTQLVQQVQEVDILVQEIENNLDPSEIDYVYNVLNNLIEPEGLTE